MSDFAHSSFLLHIIILGPAQSNIIDSTIRRYALVAQHPTSSPHAAAAGNIGSDLVPCATTKSSQSSTPSPRTTTAAASLSCTLFRSFLFLIRLAGQERSQVEVLQLCGGVAGGCERALLLHLFEFGAGFFVHCEHVSFIWIWVGNGIVEKKRGVVEEVGASDREGL
ncbi:uncharacterized protein BKA78DRAFT_18192 [Phyllosticta capitalensis]|uniref:uncharacterized protein n=1 Tax=Phyllosticta capitalensis TaxID=121624 RepID=UPI00312FE4E3